MSINSTFRRGNGSSKLKEILRKRDGDHCYICGKEMDFEPVSGGVKRGASVDHIQPRQFGGSNDYANLRLACRACNGFRVVLQQWMVKQCHRS